MSVLREELVESLADKYLDDAWLLSDVKRKSKEDME